MKNITITALCFLSLVVSAQKVIKFRPVQTPISDEEVVNPDRGFFRWNGNESAPVASKDHYQRYNWSVFEKSEGEYDFSILKAEAEKAKLDPDGIGTFSFGVRCVVQGINHAYPVYLDSKMGSWYSTSKKCWVPDWNNTYFLERLDSLVAALGHCFNKDPRIGYVEIRSYGNWGEWHLGNFEKPITPIEEISTSTIHHLVDAYVKAFPDKQLILINNLIALDYAISIPGLKYPIGWRADNWSHLGFRKFETSTLWSKAVDRWKVAPVIVEAYGNNKNNFSLSLQQIIDYHISSIGNGNIGDWTSLSNGARDTMLLCAKTSGYRNVLRSVCFPSKALAGQSIRFQAEWSNLGVAPAYRDWNVTYRICNSNGVLLWSIPSKLDLRKLLPSYDFITKNETPIVVEDEFLIPASTPSGNYLLEMMVSDPTLYFSPLQIAIQGRKPNGAYIIGDIEVIRK